jgi:hypothetical protein
MEEIWRTVVGEDDRYDVSNHGRVRSWCARGTRHLTKRAAEPQLCPQWTNSHGYRFVFLSHERKRRSVRVHKLVADAFLGPRPVDRPTVNHIDGDKTNNRVSNLEYVSNIENMRHAIRLGLCRRGKAS